MQLFGRRYDTGQPVQLEVAEGKISQMTPRAGRRSPPLAMDRPGAD